jgi:hypothetical protein
VVKIIKKWLFLPRCLKLYFSQIPIYHEKRRL